MSPERVRSETELVGSDETCLTWRERPEYDSLSYLVPGTISLSLSLQIQLTPI